VLRILPKMASKRFKKLLFVRFLTYFMILTGIVMSVAEFGPLALAEYSFRKDKLFGVKYSLPQQVITSTGVKDEPTPSPEASAEKGFGSILDSNEHIIKPVSSDYGIVIEKINANAKIIPDVDPSNQTEYVKALAQGVAESKGSTKPGEAGNLFLFSHSTDAPWNIVRFNAIFYLLRELEPGDKVSIFYQNRRYDYVVYDKNIAKSDDISFLTNRYDKPVLTMQTCDPPGTVVNRLIVRAKLVGS
jgi:LPXTG-site transpeptidase (sortase) family protein